MTASRGDLRPRTGAAVAGWPLALLLLLLRLWRPADSAPHVTHTPPRLQISPPSRPDTLLSLPPSSTAPLISKPGGGCALTLSPPTLVVRFGGSGAVNCSTSRKFSMLVWQISEEDQVVTFQQPVVWHANNVTRWNITAMCYFTTDEGGPPCHRNLSIIIYKPPGGAAIGFRNHSGPLREGQHYTLECDVWDVAPLQNLVVTFYRGRSQLGRVRANDTWKMPVNVTFNIDILASREHDGATYWCQAELQLGAEGPVEPPVATSPNMTAKVFFGPQILCPLKVRLRAGEGMGCEVVGNPPPTVTWFRDGQAVALPARLTAEHAGNYTISAKGFTERNVTVEVVVGGGSSSRCEGHVLLAALLVQILHLL